MAELLLFGLLYAFFVALEDLDFSIGEGEFVFLFHIIVFYKKIKDDVWSWGD